MSHTKGPWKVMELPHTKGDGYYHIEFENGKDISGFMGKDRARLIAESPTMYNFIESIASITVDNWDRADIESHLDMLKIDIEKAQEIINKIKAEGK